MVFKERTFICKADHCSKYWAWDNEPSIPCRRQRCKLKAFRAMPNQTRFAQNSQPFVYYENPKTGKMWIAATNSDVRRPRGYSMKREVRTMREYSRFQRDQSAKLAAESELHREAERQLNAEMSAIGRDNLRELMPSLSPAGRELARVAIERSYVDNTRAESVDCQLSGIELDRSNRQSYHDESTSWRRRD